jgi:hypothetical protein
MAVASAGAVVKGIVRIVAAGNAVKLATQRIESGELTFTPRIALGFLGVHVAH